MRAAALTRVTDLAALRADWLDLEARADLSFFQSWAWIGCRVAARFDRPYLAAVREAGRPQALALFNRRGGALHLHETGRPDEDAVFIEHNGIVAARDHPEPAALQAACLRAAGRGPLVLNGIDDATLGLLAATRPGSGACDRQDRTAPFVDLRALAGRPYLDSLSANTRYQIRRSDRSYAEDGTLLLEPAAGREEAHRFLDDLATWHQRTWTARGRPGAFADPAFGRFHHALIDRSWDARAGDNGSGEDGGHGGVELLRVSAGGRPIGYLYNFVHRGRVCAYQSGFDYGAGDKHAKPGLTCHRLAIEHAARRGAREYDFLAGDDRYKSSLANASRSLHWVTCAPRFSRAWARAAVRRGLRGVARRLPGTPGATVAPAAGASAEP